MLYGRVKVHTKLDMNLAISSEPNASELQIKKVNIVCRLNQVRSIFSELWLTRMYPNLEISSYGMEANSSIPIPKSIMRIASNWGYSLTGVESKSIMLLSRVDAVDALFIFAEKEYSQFFDSKEWECRGNYSFQSISLDRDLVAIDPIELQKSGETSLEVEIAKAILCTSIAYHLAAEKTTPLMKILFPNNVSAVSRTLDFALEQRPADAVLLDLDFHFNGYSVFGDSPSIVEWDGTLKNMVNNVIPSLQNSANPKYHVRPNKENVNPMQLMLSEDFLASIKALSERFPIIAVCGPFKVYGKEQVSTIINLALATNLQRVY